MRKEKKKGTKLFIVALASFLMLVFCIVAASPDSTLRFIDPTPANYTQEQDFTLGVLAINTHKSSYLSNDAASIGIAVLDNEGHMICDADVTLTITDPSNNATVLSTGNGLINVSPQCCVYGVTNLPDYYTNYTVDGVGTYVMNLTVTAVTADGTKSITDEFTIQNSVDFDVARDGPTRIYPPVPYVMNFTIKADKDYDGLIREYVPASFVITPQDGLIVTTVGDTKILTWTRNLVKGETYNIYYEFDAPDVSPYLFTLGELEIGDWKEARQWMIASDAPDTQTLIPNAEGDYQQWDLVDSTHWGATSDDLDSTYIHTNVQGEIDIQSLNDPTFGDLDTVYSVTIYCRANATGTGGGAEKIDFWDRLGTTDRDQKNNIGVTRDSWNEYNSGALGADPDGNGWTKQSVTNLQAGIEARAVGSAETLQVSKIWIVVDYAVPTWESYKEEGHINVWGQDAEHAYNSDYHIVYMSGGGFKLDHDYKVAYYDANGTKAHEVTDSSSNGALSSEYDFTSNVSSAAGTWHSVVLDTTDSAPITYADAIADPNYVIDDAFVVNQSAISEPTWKSYKEKQHSTVWGTEANPYDLDTHVVYMYGQRFETSHDYKVAYYDANGTKVHEVTDSSKQGALSSEYDFKLNSGAAAGTWHSVVFDTTGSAPNTYAAAIADPNYVIDDDFVVNQSAITGPKWESYKEQQHHTVWGTEANPYDLDTHVVYMYGGGFKTSHDYKVAYYDANGNKAQTEVTGSSSNKGALSSQYDFTSNVSSAAGTWHSVVLDTNGSAPNTYAAAIADPNYVIDDDFVVNQSAITGPKWESYKEQQHHTVWGTETNPYDRDTHVVYMYGGGFKTSHDYKVAYYDANGNKAQTEVIGSSNKGALSSQYDFTSNVSSAAGTWHCVVLDTNGSAPNTYAAAIADPNYVIDDDFVVNQSAIIPEFSTVIAAIAVCMLCAVAYVVMRRRAGRGDG